MDYLVAASDYNRLFARGVAAARGGVTPTPAPAGTLPVPGGDLCLSLLDLLMEAALASEEELTAVFQKIAEEHGGRFDGLECRFKGRESLERKIRGFSAKYGGMSKFGSGLSQRECDEGIWHLHTDRPGMAGDPIVVDSLRYTMVFPAERCTLPQPTPPSPLSTLTLTRSITPGLFLTTTHHPRETKSKHAGCGGTGCTSLAGGWGKFNS